MIELYSTDTILDSGAQIPLNKIASSKGTSIVRTSSSEVALARPGVYRIDVTASCVANAVGDVGIQVYKDNVPIPYAFATESASNTTSLHSLSISAIVKAGGKCCMCDDMPTISLANVGQAATYRIVNAIFTRIG